jgi:hypothetical protein
MNWTSARMVIAANGRLSETGINNLLERPYGVFGSGTLLMDNVDNPLS